LNALVGNFLKQLFESIGSWQLTIDKALDSDCANDERGRMIKAEGSPVCISDCQLPGANGQLLTIVYNCCLIIQGQLMNIQYILELVGTYFFAISGVLATEDKHRNWFGVAFTGFVTAIGGGSLRDMMLGSFPLVWIGDVNFLYGIILGVITAFIFFDKIIRLKRTMLLFDMIGIAFFTIIGVEKALSLGVRPEIAAIMGVFTAVMGGVIRDTLTNHTPVIFNKEIYATACLAGAIVYLILLNFVDRNVNLLISSSLIIIIRIIAIKFNVELPRVGKNK
jgi:uncharacterized membrane protein YeiH